jgi:hypothetical protein
MKSMAESNGTRLVTTIISQHSVICTADPVTLGFPRLLETRKWPRLTGLLSVSWPKKKKITITAGQRVLESSDDGGNVVYNSKKAKAPKDPSNIIKRKREREREKRATVYVTNWAGA